MTDIILEREDIQIINVSSEEYDIYISDEQEMYKLIRRAVETPLEYLGRYILDKRGLRGIDYDFGNAVYDDLSEGLTLGLISSIKTHIHDALTKVTPDISIQEIVVCVPTFETVEIKIQIDGLERPITTVLNI